MPPIPDVNPGDPIYAELINRIKRAVISEIRGDGVSIQTQQTGDKLIIRSALRVQGQQRPGFWLEVIGSETDSENKTRYDYRQVELDEDDDDWYAVTDGYQGLIADGTYALNGMDKPNAATGTQGNNIDIDNLNEGIELQPIALNTVHWANWARLRNTTLGSLTTGYRAVLSQTYLVDGTCI